MSILCIWLHKGICRQLYLKMEEILNKRIKGFFYYTICWNWICTKHWTRKLFWWSQRLKICGTVRGYNFQIYKYFYNFMIQKFFTNLYNGFSSLVLCFFHLVSFLFFLCFLLALNIFSIFSFCFFLFSF